MKKQSAPKKRETLLKRLAVLVEHKPGLSFTISGHFRDAAAEAVRVVTLKSAVARARALLGADEVLEHRFPDDTPKAAETRRLLSQAQDLAHEAISLCKPQILEVIAKALRTNLLLDSNQSFIQQQAVRVPPRFHG